MPRRRNPVLRHLVYGLTYAFFRFTQRLPLSLSRRIGLFLADVAYHVVPRVRTTGLANINLAYGDTLSRKRRNGSCATRCTTWVLLRQNSLM